MINRSYVFRADGNAHIGSGHLMRCLTIAEALADTQENSKNIMFLCADKKSAELVEKRGFPVRVLHTDYRHMESELFGWRQMFSPGDADNGGCAGRVILVDSYYMTEDYLRELTSFGRILVLDDLQQKAFPADAVVNYNAFADPERYQALYRSSHTKLYLGSDYVPLRPQFSRREPFKERIRDMRSQSEKVRRVLITTGGGDSCNYALAILERIYRENVWYHITAGRFSPHLEKLKQLEKQRPGVTIHHDVADMASLMRECDLAVTAGGTTVYELCALGMCFICFSYAENQEALTEYVGKHGIGADAGAAHRDGERVMERIEEWFDLLCRDVRTREAYAHNARLLTDGRGALRLARILEEI
nr:UDP-2,4-diacetamido-2,4,6-trideoxy-beta-L-altropyranose hydrolase [uncultured Acetatifactor sp.]